MVKNCGMYVEMRSVSGNTISCRERATQMRYFALRMLVEKYREDQNNLHYVFIDLEKAYDKVPKKVLYEDVWSSGKVCKGGTRYV